MTKSLFTSTFLKDYKTVPILFLTIFCFDTFSQKATFDWARRVGGNHVSRGNSVTTDAAGNVFVTGSTIGSNKFDTGSGTINLPSQGTGGTDAFVLKLSPSGDFAWIKEMGGSNEDNGQSINLDAQGNIYTTGTFYSTADFNPGSGSNTLVSAGYSDVFISKLDSSGNYLWAKRIGGTSYDRGLSIATDALGNSYTLGDFRGTVDFDPSVAGVKNLTAAGKKDIFVLKLNASGGFVWAKQMGGTDDQNSNSLSVDANGNVYVAGTFYKNIDLNPGAGGAVFTSAGSNDMFIAKLNTAGDLVWGKQIGGSATDLCLTMRTNATGDFYFAGLLYGTVDFNPGVPVVNVTPTNPGEMFVAKFDTAGNYAWVKTFKGSSDIFVYDISIDNEANVYTTGDFGGVVDFDPGVGVHNLTPKSTGTTRDIFISKLDASGNFVWAKGIGDNNYDSGLGIHVDASDNVHTTGDFTGTVDFDPAARNFNLTSNSRDIFVHKFKPCVTTTKTQNVSLCAGKTLQVGAKTYNQSGVYSDTLEATTGCDSILTTNLTVQDAVDTAVTLVDDTTISANKTPATYQWLECDNFNQPIIGATDQTFSTIINGNYAVVVTVNGCKDTSRCVPISFTVGIDDDYFAQKLKIYPNPGSGFFTLNIGSDLSVPSSFVMYNSLGDKIQESMINSNAVAITIPNASSGIYFLKVSNGSRQYYRKVIVQ